MGHEFADWCKQGEFLVVGPTRLNPSSKEGWGSARLHVEMTFGLLLITRGDTNTPLICRKPSSSILFVFLLAKQASIDKFYFHQVCSKPGSNEFQQTTSP